ncbi:MAG: STAS domain-containing protein [Pirellulales bacterium]|nr:STAS domain-containing protein [Pirellulales bacterium]
MFEANLQGAVHIISGSVPLNREHLPGLEKLISQLVAKGQPKLVLQLQGIALIDSAGLELLVDTQRRCAQRGGCLQLAMPNHLCRDILVATGLVNQFVLFDTLNAAVGSFAQ